MSVGIVLFQTSSHSVHLEGGWPIYTVYQMHSLKCKVACRHSSKFCGFSSDSIVLVLPAFVLSAPLINCRFIY